MTIKKGMNYNIVLQMEIVLFILFLFWILAQYSNTNFYANNKHWTPYMYATFTMIMCLYLFKDNTIFPDLPNYFSLFMNSKNVSWSNVSLLRDYTFGDKFEIGWCVLTKTISTIADDSIWLIFIVSFITLLGYYEFFRKYSYLFWFAIILFILTIFYNSCFVLRQNLAISICLFSMPFIIKRKIIHFSIVIFLAWTIHHSALFFAVLYPLYNIRIDKKSLSVYCLAIIFFYLMISYLNSFVLTYFPIYQTYITSERTDEGSNFTGMMISFAILIFYFSKNKNNTDIDNLIMHALLMGLGVNIVKIGLPGTFGRLANYFSAFTFVAITNACTNIKNKVVKAIVISSIISLYIYLAYRTWNYGFSLSIL